MIICSDIFLKGKHENSTVIKEREVVVIVLGHNCVMCTTSQIYGLHK